MLSMSASGLSRATPSIAARVPGPSSEYEEVARPRVSARCSNRSNACRSSSGGSDITIEVRRSRAAEIERS
jgi:hypothetical protein